MPSSIHTPEPLVEGQTTSPSSAIWIWLGNPPHIPRSWVVLRILWYNRASQRPCDRLNSDLISRKQGFSYHLMPVKYNAKYVSRIFRRKSSVRAVNRSRHERPLLCCSSRRQKSFLKKPQSPSPYSLIAKNKKKAHMAAWFFSSFSLSFFSSYNTCAFASSSSFSFLSRGRPCGSVPRYGCAKALNTSRKRVRYYKRAKVYQRRMRKRKGGVYVCATWARILGSHWMHRCVGRLYTP